MAGTESVVDITELYAAHRLSLVRLAILLVDDVASAEDVVQDAFAALARRPDAVRDPAKALAYLRVSVVNTARSALRRRRTARAYSPPHDLSPPSPEDTAVLAEEHREVIEALHRPRAAAARGTGAPLLVEPERGRDRPDAGRSARGP